VFQNWPTELRKKMLKFEKTFQKLLKKTIRTHPVRGAAQNPGPIPEEANPESLKPFENIPSPPGADVIKLFLSVIYGFLY
jgi:hypothetical protein